MTTVVILTIISKCIIKICIQKNKHKWLALYIPHNVLISPQTHHPIHIQGNPRVWFLPVPAGIPLTVDYGGK